MLNAKARRPVLLLGAGQAGVLAAKEIIGRGDLDLTIKGFIDDDKMKLGRGVRTRIEGIGKHRRFAAPVRSLGIDHVVIHDCPGVSARDPAHREDLRRNSVKVRIIPGCMKYSMAALRLVVFATCK